MSLSHYLKNGDTTLFLRDAVKISDTIAFGTFPPHGRTSMISTKRKSHKQELGIWKGQLRLSLELTLRSRLHRV